MSERAERPGAAARIESSSRPGTRVVVEVKRAELCLSLALLCRDVAG